ncbi:monovalent cation/H+ antiporter subunit E [Halorubrum luteum]
MADADSMPSGAVVVPVEATSTLRSTVAYVTEAAMRDEYAAIHFVVLASWREEDPETAQRRADAQRILERARAWVEQDLADVGRSVDVRTAIVGEENYMFGPSEYARQLAAYAAAHDADAVVLDPEYTPVGNTTLLQPMEFELSRTSLSVTEAPVERPTRRERLAKELTGVRFASLFGVSLLFYFVLGDPLYWFDWVTGVASAAIVAITLSRISLDNEPSFPETPLRILRGMVYLPVLLAEIIKSNLLVARVILDPKLPIDPTMNRVRVLVGRGLPLMTLANSITLTPGTLTTRARDENLYVHSLIPWAREGLFDGGLERWTRFVYYGRAAARLPSPRERDDVAILQGPDATEELPIAQADGGTTAETSGDSDERNAESDAEVTDE